MHADMCEGEATRHLEFAYYEQMKKEKESWMKQIW